MKKQKIYSILSMILLFNISYMGFLIQIQMGNNDYKIVNNREDFNTPIASDAFSDALDGPPYSFTHSGAANWFVTSAVSYFGGSSVRSGAITHNQLSAFNLTVNGPVQISFFWKVSSEAYFDLLKFKVNGVTLANISGSIEWKQETFNLQENRAYLLQWEYSKDNSDSVGSDAGWVDMLRVSTGLEINDILDTTLNFEYVEQNTWSESFDSKVGLKSLKAQPGVGNMSTLYTMISVPGVLSWWWLKRGSGGQFLLIEGDEIVSHIKSGSVWEYSKHAVTQSVATYYYFVYNQTYNGDYGLLDGVDFTPCDPIRNIQIEQTVSRGDYVTVEWEGASNQRVAIYLITGNQNITISSNEYSYSFGGSYSFSIPESADLGIAKIQIMQMNLVKNSFFSDEFEISMSTDWIMPVVIAGIMIALVTGLVVVVKKNQLKRPEPSFMNSNQRNYSNSNIQSQSIGSIIKNALSKEILISMPKPISVKSQKIITDMEGRSVQPISIRYKKE